MFMCSNGCLSAGPQRAMGLGVQVLANGEGELRAALPLPGVLQPNIWRRPGEWVACGFWVSGAAPVMGALITDFCLGMFSSSRKGSWTMFVARSTSTACTGTNYCRLLKHLDSGICLFWVFGC
jgi:hypothetical protein